MVNNDTAELLKECDQGVKMGIEAIGGVLKRTDDNGLRDILINYNYKHEELKEEIEERLNELGLRSEEPNFMAKGMAGLKTSFKIMLEDSDRTVADLMTDGCDMGKKSLNKYLNQYSAADVSAKDIAKKIIDVEESFEKDLKKYL